MTDLTRKRLRVLSNLGLIIGQCVLLFASRELGLLLCIVSGLLAVPFYFKGRMWDVLVLIAFLQTINFVGLFVH